jgi:hypothetical protein
MVFLFLFNIMLYGQTLSPTPTPVSKIANTIIVAKSGGEYSKIQAAVDAATTGTVIIIFPGRYEEQVDICGKNNIALVGRGNNKVEIFGQNLKWDGIDYGGSTVLIYGDSSNITLQNLRIVNATSYPYASVALAFSNAINCKVVDCEIIGEGRDTVFLYGGKGYTSSANFYTTYIEGGSDVASVESTGMFFDCYFYVNRPNEEVLFIMRANGDGVTVVNCYFDGVRGNHIANFNSNNDILYFYGNVLSETMTGYASTHGFEYRGYKPKIYYSNFAGDFNVDGTVKAESINLEKTRWKDWAACAGQPSFVDESTWHPAVDDNMTYMHCTADAKYLLFGIPYEAGTVLTRLRVKWQAEGKIDGIVMRLVKRNESATGNYWTVVGVPQTYVDGTGKQKVWVSTYNLPDETMAENYSYGIEIESEKVASGVKLFSVGAETSKRVY